ncbi:MAG: diheme cytochrome c [Chromatiaceae bacterium]|nr:diheme cytochrome c [Chromatiaceae bacterium]
MNIRSISLLVTIAIGVTALGLVASEYGERYEVYEREHEGEREGREHGDESSSAYLSDAGHALYKTECGSCHLAYPPIMLPVPSWKGVMGALGDHFGDNAELDTQTARKIADFLARNAAGAGQGRYAEGTWRSTRGRTPPLRLTETDYFRGQHHEIPVRMVMDNPGVGSFSRCDACHRGAERGDFDEHGVRIPGYGDWDD